LNKIIVLGILVCVCGCVSLRDEPQNIPTIDWGGVEMITTTTTTTTTTSTTGTTTTTSTTTSTTTTTTTIPRRNVRPGVSQENEPLNKCPTISNLTLTEEKISHLMNLCKETIGSSGNPAESGGCYKAQVNALDILGIKTKYWPGPARQSYEAYYSKQKENDTLYYMFPRFENHEYFYLNLSYWEIKNITNDTARVKPLK
jgi:hypothetical protein